MTMDKDRLPTLVTGDLHGRHEVVDAVLAEGQPVVFVGDFLDSYDRTRDDQLQTLRKVLTAVKEGKAQALMGNHEMSYLATWMQASGHGVEMSVRLNSDFDGKNTYRSAMREYLQPFVEVEGFLISHAGVSNKLLEHLDITCQEYLDRGEYCDIGRIRGGNAVSGGLFWCDWNYDFEPVLGVKQIVGHTRGQAGLIRENEGNYCIDCLENEAGTATIAEIKDGELKQRTIETDPPRHELNAVTEWERSER